MASRTVAVGPSVGLHSRPASVISKAAREYDEDIWLSMEGEDRVDAGSSLLIMTLGAERGALVTVESENADAVERIASLIEDASLSA